MDPMLWVDVVSSFRDMKDFPPFGICHMPYSDVMQLEIFLATKVLYVGPFVQFDFLHNANL